MMDFRKLSIRHKLTMMMFLMAVIALLCGFIVHVMQDVKQFKQDLVDSAASTARVVGDYSVVDLAFDDHEAARRTLSKLDSNPIVEQACLYDSEGKLFAEYAKPWKPSCAQQAQLAPSVIEGDIISVTESISYQNQNYGRISMHVSSQSFREKLHGYFVAIVLLSLGLLALSFILALRFQKVISQPILEMVETTRAISANDNFALRLESRTEDEIGSLSREFNALLSRIEKGKEERDRVEKALRDSENRYRLLIESSPEAIYLEQEGKIIYANPAGLRLYGCHSISDLQGVRLSSLFPNFDNVLKKYKSSPLEHTLMRSDGQLLPVEVSFIVTVFQGKSALQVLAWDITESKTLRQSAERVQRLAALGEFSAILAHEIRNSLGSITLNMKTLSERLEIPEAYRKTFSNMDLGIQRIQEVIRGILDFARPTPPSLRSASIHRILDRSLQSVESEMEQAGITVVREYDSQDPEVLVDPGQISQVFVNLLTNAKHATEPGGQVTISTSFLNSVLEVRIADTGKGIPQADLERIFDPFFTTKPFGSGLGLALVSRILEQHHVPIHVQSQVGKGTVFAIQFRAGGGTS